MTCFQCGKGSLRERVTVVRGRVRGEEISIPFRARECRQCGFQAIAAKDMAAYGLALADAYRQKHGLLTSKELKETRSRLGLSQRAFADYLKVGVASVKRWEGGLIQDEAMDHLIRLKTSPKAARQNLRELSSRMASSASASAIRPSASRA